MNDQPRYPRRNRPIFAGAEGVKRVRAKFAEAGVRRQADQLIFETEQYLAAQT
ncbi:hypothetical protein [Kribbella deserti]|uniref:Uncharacterized protein n=1 Tax=Kribbella deserti TaxID=1926257 RepID=A0ABV6QNB6_9ACTN